MAVVKNLLRLAAVGAMSLWPLSLAAAAQAASAEVIAAGRLLSVEGQPLAGRVVLLMWPSQPGDSGELRVVASDTFAAGERFALGIAAGADLSEGLDAQGNANFQLVALGDDGRSIATYGFSRHVERAPSGDYRYSLPGTTAAPALAMDLRAGELAAGASAAAGEPPWLDCAEKDPEENTWDYDLMESYAPSFGIVGEAWLAPGTTARFTYSEGATSELGFATSLTLGAGSFQASGTFSESSTAAVGFPVADNDVGLFLTGFRYGTYRVRCIRGVSPPLLVEWYQTQVLGWAGGAQTFRGARAIEYLFGRGMHAPTPNHCVSYGAGSSLMRDESEAHSFSAGIGISSPRIGNFNLSTRTGYSSSASMRYEFSQNVNVCGDTDHAIASKRVSVHPVPK